MIFLYAARLVILSQPKTGTTALDHALAPRASISVNNPPAMKHVPYHKFMTFVAPWLQAQTGLARSQYDVVSVMREPIDWLGSWYRYRTREQLKETTNRKRRGNYTGNVTFDEFVQEVLKPKSERATYAGLGSPCGVALNSDGGVGCDRIFPYEDLSGLHELIEERSKNPVYLKLMNVSPVGDITLSDETRERLKTAWQFAFDLHGSLTRDGKIEPRFHAAGDADTGEDSVVAD
jgi:hypothetical protein